MGSKPYIAPEILSDNKYDGHKSDIFSIGVILWTLVNGKFPFTEAKLNDSYYSLLLNNEDLYLKKLRG